MQAFLLCLEVIAVCITLLGVAVVSTLRRPQSRGKLVALEVFYWAVTVGCSVAIASRFFGNSTLFDPVEVVEDIGFLMIGVWACLNAVRTRKARGLLY